MYDSNLSGTGLSAGVYLYSAENPELDTGIARRFPECVGMQRNWTYLFVCSVQYIDCVYGAGFGISEIYEASE